LACERSNLYALCACFKGDVAPQADWEAIAGMANRTLTTPSLAASLQGKGALPNDLEDFLCLIRNQTTVRNKMMLAQLEECLNAISTKGVCPILLKGAAFLAQAAEPNTSRICSDLDILVGQEHLEETIAALEAIGYCREGVKSEPGDGANLSRNSDAGGIDLHCRLKTTFPRYGYAEIAPTCREIPVGSATALIPSPAFQAAILILHDQLQERDYWRGLIDLRHLLDLRRLATARDGIDWDALMALFPKGYPRRALHTQLATLEHFFGVRVPQATRESRSARWQLRRRLVQLDHKWQMPAFTAFSLLADPPRRPTGYLADHDTETMPARSRTRRMLRTLGRHFREASINKL
jgi:Uncharacterised nucleotidyltransferase